MDIPENFTDDEDFVELINIDRRLPKTYRHRPDNFVIWNENQFVQRFRLSKQTIRMIIDEISEDIQNETTQNHALTPEDMIFVTLRFLSSGSFLQIVGDLQGIDKGTASRIVSKTIAVLARRFKYLIQFPQTEEETRSVQRGFYNIVRLSKCIGALDCTHVKIISPEGDNAENYRNRKGFFSYNIQVVCDSNLQILNIVCRWPGSTHDSTIFFNSRIRAQFEGGNFNDSILVGDSGYGIRPFLITPLHNPRSPAEQLFNEAQIRTRNPIERCFGVWKRRFPILALGIRVAQTKVEGIVIAAAVLHNLAIKMKDRLPTVDEETEAAINLVNNVHAERYPGNEETVNNITRVALIRYYENLL